MGDTQVIDSMVNDKRRFHVKHESLGGYLRSYLSEMDIHPSPEQTELLLAQIDLVLVANQRVNLTRVTEPHEVVRLHTADSLAILQDVESAPDGQMLDLGTGAGFPGLPLAVCSPRNSVLLDSVGKKASELRRIVSEMGLSARVRVVAERAEALSRIEPQEFSVVTARAVSKLAALVELASPLLSEGGVLLCLKGSPDEDELGRGKTAATLVGMVQHYTRSFDLPEGAGHRTIVCYKRTGAPSIALPRREGLAQNYPLA